jgi:hypothetical protein
MCLYIQHMCLYIQHMCLLYRIYRIYRIHQVAESYGGGFVSFAEDKYVPNEERNRTNGETWEPLEALAKVTTPIEPTPIYPYTHTIYILTSLLNPYPYTHTIYILKYLLNPYPYTHIPIYPYHLYTKISIKPTISILKYLLNPPKGRGVAPQCSVCDEEVRRVKGTYVICHNNRRR